ncbi:hypothetical protein ACJMK2_038322, partial [Sinanodonta woodiana]
IPVYTGSVPESQSVQVRCQNPSLYRFIARIPVYTGSVPESQSVQVRCQNPSLYRFIATCD